MIAIAASGAVGMAGRRKKSADGSDPAGQMLRAVRKAERQAGDGSEISGTGFTILKMRLPPVAKLIESKRIGPDERDAAKEIELAFLSIDGRARLQGMTMDRVDNGRQQSDQRAAKNARAVGRYQAWATYWSARNKAYGDPMLEIIVAAVIDERPIRTIALDVGRRHSKVEDAVVFGLRDYAARAGMVSGGMGKQWMTQAEGLFVPARTVLLDAVRRAKVER